MSTSSMKPGSKSTTEEALRRERDRAQQYLDIAGVILVAIDKRGCVTMINKKGCEVLGYDEAEIIGKNWFDTFLPKWLRDSVVPVFHDLIAGATAGVEYYENPVVNSRGEERRIAWHNQVLREKDGRIIGTLSSGEDITERHIAEQARKQSEKWLVTTLSSIGEAVLAADVHGKISFINPVAEVLTGWSAAEARKCPLPRVFNIIDESSQEPVVDAVSTILSEQMKKSVAPVKVLISKDGTRKHVAINGSPIATDSGQPLGVVFVFRDLTEEREREAMLLHHQKLQSLGTLAAGIAHEINNPLNGIMNYGELLQLRLGPQSPLVGFAKGIVEECERIGGIVKNLLAFSRQQVEAHSPARIADIIATTLSLIERILHRDQIEIIENIPGDLPKINCRSQQIMQVLMNLITNARDALNEKYSTYDENKQIEISARLFKKDGIHWIRTSVSDRGLGIPPEIMPRIFDPFFTTKPTEAGTGLGLSVSHGIIQAHHGRLWAESTVGHGSQFHIDLQVDNR
ncbi:MAG: PAS domain S-box protein [Myxococcota bacterium]|nr:PAS domain S-box protein [Myxococcota bacterium]